MDDLKDLLLGMCDRGVIFNKVIIGSESFSVTEPTESVNLTGSTEIQDGGEEDKSSFCGDESSTVAGKKKNKRTTQ